MAILIIFIIIVAVGYYASLRVHPLTGPGRVDARADGLDHPGVVVMRDLELVDRPRDRAGPRLVVGRVDA